jgi:hypothetical protein
MTLTPRSREHDGHVVAPDRSLLTLIERTIKGSDLPPTKTELRKALPPNTTAAALESALDLLVSTNKVLVDRHRRMVWVAVDNPKLKALFDSSVEIK